MRLVNEGESTVRLKTYLIDIERRLEGLRLRLVYIKHMEETRDRLRRPLMRRSRSSDSDEKRERLGKFFVRPKSEIHEDILMPQVALGRRFWNMINP